jgi:hypothetical protein
MCLYVTHDIDTLRKLISVKFLRYEDKVFPLSLCSLDYIQATVTGFAPNTIQHIETFAHRIFSRLGDLMDTKVESTKGIASTRVTLIFRKFPPLLANVSRLIFKELMLYISWPKFLQPKPEFAKALDFCPVNGITSVPLVYANEITKMRFQGQDPRLSTKVGKKNLAKQSDIEKNDKDTFVYIPGPTVPPIPPPKPPTNEAPPTKTGQHAPPSPQASPDLESQKMGSQPAKPPPPKQPKTSPSSSPSSHSEEEKEDKEVKTNNSKKGQSGPPSKSQKKKYNKS